jgi:Prokaryotic dksA/traR C4-type zinc finger
MKTLERMCSDCEEPISSARLKAKPDTTLCVNCKAKLKKHAKAKRRENPQKVKRKNHRLPPRLFNALPTLPLDKALVLTWTAIAGTTVADELAKKDARIKRLKDALAAKHRFESKKLMTIHAALRQLNDEAVSIVSKAMNTEAKTIRLVLKPINVKLEKKKAVVSVKSKKREFVFSVEEKMNLDEVRAMLSKAGIK